MGGVGRTRSEIYALVADAGFGTETGAVGYLAPVLAQPAAMGRRDTPDDAVGVGEPPAACIHSIFRVGDWLFLLLR